MPKRDNSSTWRISDILRSMNQTARVKPAAIWSVPTSGRTPLPKIQFSDLPRLVWQTYFKGSMNAGPPRKGMKPFGDPIG